MGMSGFICQDKYLERTKRMTDAELGRLFRACMIYHARGEEVELDGRESMAFDFIREDIDAAENAYANKCETNRRNRSSASKEIETVDNDREQPITPDDNINIIKTELKGNKNINKTKKRESDPQKRFTPPTLEEVAAYCRERNNGVDPEKFIAFYASKGWKVGNQPMKDWKMCVITWEKRDKTPTNSSANYPVKVLPAQQYEQRESLNSMDEIRQRMLAMMNGGMDTG